MDKGEILLDLIRTRQSVRGYINKPLAPEKIIRCLEAARLSPSACNSQPWKFIVIDEPALKNEIADATSDKILPLNHFVKQAPVLIVIVMEKPNILSKFGELVKDKKFSLIDIGIAAEHFCLQAHAEGLGTCMIGWLKEEKIKSLLNIPKNKRPILIITIGYPSSDKLRKKIRKTSDEITCYNSYR